jgi:hypothetical protein
MEKGSSLPSLKFPNLLSFLGLMMVLDIWFLAIQFLARVLMIDTRSIASL